MYLGNIIVLS